MLVLTLLPGYKPSSEHPDNVDKHFRLISRGLNIAMTELSKNTFVAPVTMIIAVDVLPRRTTPYHSWM
jgi:hypothetical protein